jgi:hypothetical protein
MAESDRQIEALISFQAESTTVPPRRHSEKALIAIPKIWPIGSPQRNLLRTSAEQSSLCAPPRRRLSIDRGYHIDCKKAFHDENSFCSYLA